MNILNLGLLILIIIAVPFKVEFIEIILEPFIIFIQDILYIALLHRLLKCIVSLIINRTLTAIFKFRLLILIS